MKINLHIEADSVEEFLSALDNLSSRDLGDLATNTIAMNASGAAAETKTKSRTSRAQTKTEETPAPTNKTEETPAPFKSDITIDQLRALAGSLKDPMQAKNFLNNDLKVERLTELKEELYQQYFDKLTSLKNLEDL